MKWPASYKHFICALLKRLLKVNAQWIEDSTHRAIQHQDWDWGRPYEKCDLFVVSGKNITLEEFISVLEKQYSDTDVARAIQELMMRCAHAEECVSEMKIQIERLKSEFPTKPH
jgi:primosomal protein N''